MVNRQKIGGKDKTENLCDEMDDIR